MAVEPIPGEPAAVVDTGDGRLLVLADLHAGVEAGLKREGVELDSRADRRRERVLSLIDRAAPDRVVVVGDFGDAIGEPGRAEREEADRLLTAVTDRVPVTLVTGNHDGAAPALADTFDRLDTVPGAGVRIGSAGFAHGHTWPDPEALAGDVLCTAHEHPVVRLEDEVGGYRLERVWLRGELDPEPFERFHGSTPTAEELVVFPAFNDLSGGTWINVDGRDFLSPFLPEALIEGQAYLLDGTRLGTYASV